MNSQESTPNEMESIKSLAYDFSKEFSKHGRKELADKIRELRQKYEEKTAFENIETLGEQIEKKKSELWGNVENGIYPDGESVADVVIDSAWYGEAHKLIENFYAEQNEIRKAWELDRKEREVEKNAEKYHVLFLHGIPFEEPMKDTAKFNTLIDTAKMTPEDKSHFLAGLEPTISVSSKSLDPEVVQTLPEKELMYDTGFIIGRGEIMSAFEVDSDTRAESIKIKSIEGPSSVQTPISEQIEKAVRPGIRHVDKNKTWNELIVRNPKVAGIYVTDRAENEGNAIPRIEKLSGEMHVPVIRITRDGKMFNLTENREVTANEIMKNPATFTLKERVDFLSATKSFLGGISKQIQKRLEEFERAQM